jgi:hypothetical protein
VADFCTLSQSFHRTSAIKYGNKLKTYIKRCDVVTLITLSWVTDVGMRVGRQLGDGCRSDSRKTVSQTGMDCGTLLKRHVPVSYGMLV